MAEQLRRRRAPRRILAGGLAAIVVAAGVFAGGGTAVAAVGTPAVGRPVAGGGGTGDPGVRVGEPSRAGRHVTVTVPVSGSTPVSGGRAPRGRVSPSLQCADCDPGGGGDGGGGSGFPVYGCNANLSYDIGPVQQDAYLEETVHIGYSAWLSCNYALDSADARALLKDRSPAFHGQSFEDTTIDSGSPILGGGISSGTSSGSVTVSARTYNGGRSVEPVFDLTLLNPSWLIWSACNPIPNLRYLACDGLGTRVLHVAIGANPQTTALTSACRDQTDVGDVEQARLDSPAGGPPAPIGLVKRVDTIEQAVIAFKHDLCGVTDANGASALATNRGLALWTAAVAAAKANVAQGDARPLYWARLSMTRALRQWRPTFSIGYSALRTALELNSRGMTSDSFGLSTTRRVFVSGFDPFQLFTNVTYSNSSGASVLRLDGAVVAGAEVQAVIFPARFEDFDAGLVEQVFAPHLGGSRAASLVMTTSQGGDRFELDTYYGRNRTDAGHDNLYVLGAISEDQPIPPPGLASGAEFLTTTLPVDAMTGVGGPALVVRNATYKAMLAGQILPPSSEAPPDTSTAIWGSGHGWLSNEIAYRVALLRGGLSLPVGHVHLPSAADPGAESVVAAQFEALVAAAVNAT